jgi:hypothetical protein
MGDGSVVAVALAYAGRPDTDLWISVSGCSTISNGAVSALWPPEDLLTLAPAASSPS